MPSIKNWLHCPECGSASINYDTWSDARVELTCRDCEHEETVELQPISLA